MPEHTLFSDHLTAWYLAEFYTEPPEWYMIIHA